MFDRNIPDDQWPRAKRVVADIAAEYGFATMGLQIDKPGRHRTHGSDPNLGAYYDSQVHVTSGT